jgi:hypothetical protein
MQLNLERLIGIPRKSTILFASLRIPESGDVSHTSFSLAAQFAKQRWKETTLALNRLDRKRVKLP